MVRLTRIYTRGGDSGETSLGDGSRAPKQSLRVVAFGTVDEANAALGIARLHAEGEVDAALARIQNDLFDLGADLCTPHASKRSEGALRIVQHLVRRRNGADRLHGRLGKMKDIAQPRELASLRTEEFGLSVLQNGEPHCMW